MKLEEFILDEPKFLLSSTGKQYELRVMNISDRAEMSRLCGGDDKVQETFTKRNWKIISRLVYRLLKDKSEFMASKEHIIDDDGFEKEITLLGHEKLHQAIMNQEEEFQVISALTASIIKGDPIAKKAVEDEVKKNLLDPQTGESSLTSSLLSTDTRLSNSDNSLSERST